MKEPIERGFSILKKQVTPEPKITYTLPDGSTTIWLNEYTDALVQAEQDRIVKLFEEQDNVSWFGLNEAAIKLIRGDKQ